MKSIANLLISLIVTGWVSAIAIVSVQNATPISLKFLGFQSIQMPFGVALAFCAGAGMAGMGLLQPLLGLAPESEEEED